MHLDLPIMLCQLGVNLIDMTAECGGVHLL